MRNMRSLIRSLVLIAPFLLSVSPATSRSGKTGDATDSASAFDGTFTIRGVTGHARHTHGGESAHIGHVRFEIENRGTTARKLTVAGIEFLRGIKDCEHAPSEVASRPKSGGIFLEDGVQKESRPQVTVNAGAKVGAMVGFVAVDAYYVYCDRFAVRVRFNVDGSPLVVTDEVVVMRIEPLREHDH